jgi:outer membrane immunogenic protein
MYRKLLLASVGALALTGSVAFAADYPTHAPPPVYLPPIFTWTGIYVGGQIGYGWGSYTFADPFDNAFGTTGLGGSPSGVIGGAHVGYNYQVNQFVFGLEGTVDGTSVSNTVQAVFPIAFGGSTLSAHTSSDIQGSIRGRAGIAWERALIYATGGVAFGGFNTNYSFTGNLNGNKTINSGNDFFRGNRASPRWSAIQHSRAPVHSNIRQRPYRIPRRMPYRIHRRPCTRRL